MLDQNGLTIQRCLAFSIPFTERFARLDSLPFPRQTLKVVAFPQGGLLRRLILILQVVAAATASAQVGERPGPTILSRGLGTVLQGGGELLRLRPYFSVAGIYDSGIVPFSVNQQGEIPVTDAYGAALRFGAYGYHQWRHTLLGLDYRGDVRHYDKNNYYDGSDHRLTLSLTHQPSRWLALTFREAASSMSQSEGWLNGYQLFDPATAGAPINDLFYGRTDSSTSMGDVTFILGRRLSFDLGGSGTIVRRRSSALIGMTGWSGHGDLQLSVNRRFSLGADYSFTHYAFANDSGRSDINSLSLDLAFRLGRGWDLGLRGGASRVESLNRQSIILDPVLAAIFGQSRLVFAVHNLNYFAQGEARLAWVGRNKSVTLNYYAGVAPGNGIYLTSRSQNGGAAFSYSTRRRWNFGVNASYSTYSSIYQQIGDYSAVSGGGGLTYKVNEWLHITGDYRAHRNDVSRTSYPNRFYTQASVGLAFSPGEFPLSLW